jgi:peptidoglycan/xylan/chitin deacetylase (PgdA/CDA1 family)
MRVVVFSTYSRERLAPWLQAIRRTPAVSDVLAIGPDEAEFLKRHPRDPMLKAGALLAELRAWNADCGVAIAAPRLPPLVYTIPASGTLNVRLGEAQSEWPGLRELWYGMAHASAYVHWLGVDRRAIGAAGRVPVYNDDTIEAVGKRLEELAQLLLTDALARVATGAPPGSEPVHPEPHTRPTKVGRHIALRLRTAIIRFRNRLTPFTVAKLGATALWLALFRPLRDLTRTIIGRHPVRIFTLHRVSRLCRDGMTVEPETFRRQMQYLRRSHDVVDLDKAMSLVANGAKLRRPVAAVTFDDGYETVATEAAPVLAALGIAGACFVCPRIVGANGRFPHDDDNPAREWMRVMGWETIRALHKAGWHIGSHTESHCRVSTLEGETLRSELLAPQASLREQVSPRPVAFAYPFGGVTDITPEAVTIARQGGYLAVLSDFGGENVPGQADHYELRRIDIGGGHDDLMWRAMMHGLDLAAWRRRRVG